MLLNTQIREACRFPRSVHYYVAPMYTQARKIVWDDPNMLRYYLPDQDEFGWTMNEQKLMVTFENQAILRIFGADKPEDLKGPNADSFGLDEWQLINPDVWSLVFLPMFTTPSMVDGGYRKWAMFLWTPQGKNHATQERDKHLLDPRWFVSRLRASESHLRTDDELAEARREMRLPWMYDQEYECAEVTDEERALITSLMLDDLPRRLVVEPYQHRRIVSTDPDCSLNGDTAVIYFMEDGQVKDEDIFHERNPLNIAQRANVMGTRYGCDLHIVDWIGVGTGVCAQLAALGKEVIEFKGSESPIDGKKFANSRAESYWYTMDKILDKDVLYPDGFPSAERLREELTAVKFSPGASKTILLEPKTYTKKRLGRSPDCADAYTMGLWGLQQAQPISGSAVEIESPVESHRRLIKKYRRPR